MKNKSTHFGVRAWGTGVAILFVATAATQAVAAPVTFAQYVQTNGAQQQWSISTSGTVTTIMATGSVSFSFSGVSGVPFVDAEPATFQLQATSSQIGTCGVACANNDSFIETGFSGTFSFIDAGSVPGANLLSGTFAVTGSPATTGAQFSSSIGGTGGSFNASATAGNLNQLVMTSDYLSFVGQTQETASWSLSSLIPNFAVGAITNGQAYPSSASAFDAAGSGTFSSNPGPVSATPEPATFALIGLGLVGVSFARRGKRSRS